jgi:Protein of unknown function (DUF1569)
MSVDTKTVPGRRQLQFASLDEVVADAEKCVSSPNTKMLGNWPLERILGHLTKAMNGSIDGMDLKPPMIARLIGPMLKGRMLKKGMPPGIKLSTPNEEVLYPDVPSTQKALEAMRLAAGRLKTEKPAGRHPVFGKMTPEDWIQLHLRHAELHLSYALPG